MELLGFCLGDVRKNNGYKFSLATIFRLAINLIEIYKNVHKCGILHRDCKLKNYLLNTKGTDVYIIDFGLSDRWKTKKNKHIPFSTGLLPYGTIRYAPLAVHLGYEQGRKDDLEALGNMLIYLARGQLPWQSLWHEDKKIIWRDVGRMKLELSLSVLCQDISPCFEKFMIKVRSLNFSQSPQYDELKELFYDAMNSIQVTHKHPYDWEYSKN